MLQLLDYYITIIFSLLVLLATGLTTIHILLSRRAAGSSIAWMGLVWLAPLLGVTTYLLLGINRIQRRAETLRSKKKPFFTIPKVSPVRPDTMQASLPPSVQHLSGLAHFVDQIVQRPLLPGARIEPLFDGDQAYPAMIEAINNAQTSISLATYIFDNDAWGKRFVKALSEAVKRGVEVRVLVDAAGLRYSFPSIRRPLRQGKVPTRRFLPSMFPPHLMTMNLRNHRKIMVVDGTIGFTGGLNIRAAHVIQDNPKFPTHDLHFRIQGPVVAHLQEVFFDDWVFSTGEELRGEKWFPPLTGVGTSIARGIPDGPDEDFNKLRWTILGALTHAQRRVVIVTPYFLPDAEMITNLSLAAVRGIQIDIVLPATNNLPFIHWASMSQIRPLLERGCNIWFTPGAFDHSKLLIIDSDWVLLGSANWDERSFRLNFEFNVECYDEELAKKLETHVDQRIETAHRYTLDEYDKRSIGVRLRDGFMALFSPYL